MPHSDALEANVTRCAAKLEGLFDRITACKVMVKLLHGHALHDKRYHCRINITVPGGELVVGKNPSESIQHEDMHAAIDDAFDDAERLLVDHNARLRERRKAARSA